jgi:hypothetical protein
VPLLGHEVAARIALDVQAGRDLRELLLQEASLEATEIEQLFDLRCLPLTK